jgi:hypothetical protein
MGVTIVPYPIKIDELKAVFGSKDKKLYKKLLETDDFEYYSDEEEEWMEEGDVTTKKALKAIIFGEKKEGSGFTYGYCLKLVVDYHLEKSFEDIDTTFTFGTLYDDINLYLAKNNVSINLSNMLDKIYEFDIPIIEDFPEIGGISKENIAIAKLELEQLVIDPDEIDSKNKKYSEIKEGVHIFRNCINYCFKNDCELIAFAH